MRYLGGSQTGAIKSSTGGYIAEGGIKSSMVGILLRVGLVDPSVSI